MKPVGEFINAPASNNKNNDVEITCHPTISDNSYRKRLYDGQAATHLRPPISLVTASPETEEGGFFLASL